MVPVGFRYNPDLETIDIGGHNFASSKKYRDAPRHGRVAFVVDDVLPPWRPRMIEIRATVEAFTDGGIAINQGFAPEFLRLNPTYIVFFGSSGEPLRTSQGVVRPHGRQVT